MRPSVVLGVLAPALAAADPLACQPNSEQPMLPTFHIIGNVTKNADGSIKLENINDCSGITYYGGVYHVWHQCCQNHFDHVISKDLIHWQRLPPPVEPWSGKGGYKTWDGSVSILPTADGGPIILYDAQDGKLDDMHRDEYLEKLHGPRDSPILGVARLVDLNDKYLLNFSRRDNPVVFDGEPAAFPGQIWKNGDHWNMVMQGTRYQSNDSSFHNWANMGPMVGHRENGGQWWMPVPNQIDGTAPPAGVPNRIVNIGGGDHYLFGTYDPSKESFTPWSNAPTPVPTPAPPHIPYSRMMNNTDLPGGDFNTTCEDDVCHKPPSACQAVCDAEPKCKAWTLVPGSRCCLKGNVPRIHPHNGMTSGVKDPNAPTPPPGPPPSASGTEAHLEGGHAAWFGAQMTHDPEGKVKDRAFMIGWATGDYHGPAGPGISVLTRLTGLREINYDAKTMNLVANPLPELKGLRTGSLAHEKAVALAPGSLHAVKGTGAGAASSADIELTFSGAGVASGGTFGACVLANSTHDGLGISITVANHSGTRTATVAVGACSAQAAGVAVAAEEGARLGGAPAAPLFDEQTVSVRITPDRSLADFFVQGGRWAGTLSWVSGAPRKAEDSDVLLWSKTDGVTADVDVYSMGCGWADPSYTEHPTM